MKESTNRPETTRAHTYRVLRQTWVQFATTLFLWSAAWPLLSTTVAAAAPTPTRLEGIELIPRLRITGTVGTLLRIEYRDASSPSNSWQTLKSLILPSSPLLFLDPDATSRTQRFYRVMTDTRPPPLVWIPAGSFTFGSSTAEQYRLPDEGPLSVVRISKGFWIGQYEVTQEAYVSIMGMNPSWFPDDLTHPVEMVSWDGATAYCLKLTETEGRAGRLPAGYAYRLPTEAEWEYAARAGTSTRYSFGDDAASTLSDNYVWFGSNSSESSHSVGSKAPNAWGLYDMHGNVWEWCSDWYANSHSSVSLLGLLDPKGPLTGIDRVLRGGSWKGPDWLCRSASRSAGAPSLPNSNVGFRVVLAPSR